MALLAPSNAVEIGEFPPGIGTLRGAAWDGLQLVIVTASALWTLARNINGTYTPGNATESGATPAGLSGVGGITWDGMQLVLVTNNDRIWVLSRNADGTYTPSSAVRQTGTFPAGLSQATGITWDGFRLLITDNSGDELWRLSRDTNGTYSPADAIEIGNFPSALDSPQGLAWDEENVLIADNGGDTLWRLPRTGNDTYSIGNAASQGAFPDELQTPVGITYDGLQLVIVDQNGGELWTLGTDNVAPAIADFDATPAIVDSGGTTTLSFEGTDENPGDTLDYQLTSSVGGTFSVASGSVPANGVVSVDWTAPAVTEATAATISLTVEDQDGLQAMADVQVTVRAPVPALALPDPSDQTGATGDIVDVLINSATGGRAPYSYAFSGLPDELGAILRRVRGRLIEPGTFAVDVTATDANGDTASRTFDWTVTGNAIPAPAGLNVRMDWGDGFYSNPHADVTARITSGINFQRGRRTGSATRGRVVAGSMEFELQNGDGLFDQEDMSSPLHGLIRPGIRVQFRHGATPLWTGVLDEIPTRYAHSGQHRAQVSALGVWSLVQDADVVEGSLAPEATIQAHCDLLASVDLCGLPVGSGYYVMPRWWETGSLNGALRHIEDTEGGLIIEDTAGNLPLQSRGFRAAKTVSQTFSGLANPGAGHLKVHGRPKREIAVKDITNQVVGYIREFATRDALTILERGEAIPVGLGSTVTITADFEGGAVEDIDPITDFTANAEPDGSGADRKAALTLSASIGQFNEILVEVSYPTGGGFSEAELYLTTLNVTGTVLQNVAPSKVTRTNPQSNTRYRRKSVALRDTWITSAGTMIQRADDLLDALAAPETRMAVQWVVTDYATLAGMEISDRHRVIMPNYEVEGFLEHEAVHVPLDRALPVATFSISVAE